VNIYSELARLVLLTRSNRCDYYPKLVDMRRILPDRTGVVGSAQNSAGGSLEVLRYGSNLGIGLWRNASIIKEPKKPSAIPDHSFSPFCSSVLRVG
jgi:hypothetical protein